MCRLLLKYRVGTCPRPVLITLLLALVCACWNLLLIYIFVTSFVFAVARPCWETCQRFATFLLAIDYSCWILALVLSHNYNYMLLIIVVDSICSWLSYFKLLLIVIHVTSFVFDVASIPSWWDLPWYDFFFTCCWYTLMFLALAVSKNCWSCLSFLELAFDWHKYLSSHLYLLSYCWWTMCFMCCIMMEAH